MQGDAVSVKGVQGGREGKEDGIYRVAISENLKCKMRLVVVE